MSTKAEKFIIALQTQYEGSEQVKELQSDLDALGQVEKLQKYTAELDTLALEMQKGAAAASEMKAAMDGSFDPKLAARLKKTQTRVQELSGQYERQRTTLGTYADALARAKDNLQKFESEIADSPTAGEQAKLAKLADTVASAEGRYVRYQQTVGRTNAAMEKARDKTSELSRALKDSVDPALAATYRKQADELARQEKKTGALKKNIDELTGSLAAQGVNTGKLAAEQQRLSTATEKSARQMAVFKSVGMRSFADINREVSALKASWKALDKSQMSLSERFAGWDRMRQRIAGLKEQTNGWTSQVHRLQQGWAGVVGILGTLSIGKRALDEFVSFDDAMLRVQALSGSVGEEFEMLKKQAQDLGATTRFTATEAAQGMSELASTGMSAKEIFDTLPGAMDMAAISGMGVKESADRMTDIMSQFGLKTEQAVHVVDVLTQGYTGASTSMEELGQAMTYVGPVSSKLGYSLEETTAILQALAESGYKGERAGTALKGGLSRLIKPSEEAAMVLERYNIQIMDSKGNMRAFTDILGDMGDASLSSRDLITLFGQEAGPGMMALLGQGADAIRGYEEKLENVDGVAADVAAKMESGIGGSLRRLGAAITSIAISFGSTFAPAVSKVADVLSACATAVSSLPEPMKLVTGLVSGAIVSFAAWKMGLSLVASAIGRFGLDLVGIGRTIWAFAFQTVPAYISSLATAEAGTTLFGATIQAVKLKVAAMREGLNLLAARLPLIGKLLTTSSGDFFKFSTAATKAGAALRLVGAAGMLLAAWEVGQMVGKWLNQFSLVRKFGLKLTEMFIMLGLRAKQAWAWVSGGDTEAVAKEIETAKKTFDEMYEKIDKGTDLQVKENDSAQEAITAKVQEEAKKQIKAAEAAAAGMKEAYASVNPDGAKEKKKPKKDAFGFTEEENAEAKRQYELLDKEVKHRPPRHKTVVQAIDGKIPTVKEAAQALAELAAEKSSGLAQRITDRIPTAETSPRKVEEETLAKTVEIKIGGARLRATEADANSFIDQLEAAALLA